MRVIICNDYHEMSEKAARLVAGQLTLKPDSVLGLATGSTPVGMYNELIRLEKQGEIDFGEAIAFNLDEYYPIAKSNDQSYDYFMRHTLFDHVNIREENHFIPNGECSDPEAECKEYELKIRAHGGIDLQILGIGENGHIGFNEPDANLNTKTHLTDLTESTISANARFFQNEAEVPRQALTMGISTILKSKKIVLLASGANKSRVVSELLNDDINTNIPATLLKVHPDVVLICDKDAMSGVRLGIDIGGTEIKFAVLEGNEPKFKTSIPTETQSYDAFLNSIAETCNEILKTYPVKTVGIGTPGFINEGKVTAINLPLSDVALAKDLKAKMNLPVHLDNDANCAALGESLFGVGKEYDNSVMITLGTGLGGGIIFDHRICHGKNSTGEIGHMIIQAHNGRKCPCGQSGCFEQYASVTALLNSAKEAAEKAPDSILADCIKEKLSGRTFFSAVDKNCPIAQSVLDEYLDYLAVGIISIINILGPDAVILSGGITARGDKIIGALTQKVARPNVKILISKLQNDAGALGAAML